MTDFVFELFRISLRQRQQKDFRDLIEPEQTSRETWLRTLFSQYIEFRHHGTDFVYVPDAYSDAEDLIIGRLGRSFTRTENKPPDEHLEEFSRQAWFASTLVIDPRTHEDGQKVAIQRVNDVGKPQALAPRLLSALEEKNAPTSFLASILPITNENAFWDFAEQNKGNITSISFALEVPNMWGGDDDYTEEMRRYRELEKAKTVETKIANPDGLDVHTDRMRYAVEKASEGNGSIRAKARGKNNRFNSKNRQATTAIPEDTLEDKPLVRSARSLAQRILGRE